MFCFLANELWRFLKNWSTYWISTCTNYVHVVGSLLSGIIFFRSWLCRYMNINTGKIFLIHDKCLSNKRNSLSWIILKIKNEQQTAWPSKNSSTLLHYIRYIISPFQITTNSHYQYLLDWQTCASFTTELSWSAVNI